MGAFHHRPLLVEAHEGDDCNTPNPSDDDQARAVAAEIKTFGKPVNSMSRGDLSNIVRGAIDSKKPANLFGRRNLQINPEYTLVDIPIVFHVLTAQGIAGSTAGPPSATAAQLDWVVEQANKLYTIYDKPSKTSVEWASFTRESIYHDNLSISGDCSSSLSSSDFDAIIKAAVDWQYKMHVIICESTSFSGRASFPGTYSVTNVKHNMCYVEYRALPCYDDDGNFLCELTGGEQISHTRWWRIRGITTTHEIGHLFG